MNSNPEIKDKLQLIPFLLWFKDAELEKEYDFFRWSNPKLRVKRVILAFAIFYTAIIFLDLYLSEHIESGLIILKSVVSAIAFILYFVCDKISYVKRDYYLMAFTAIAFLSVILQASIFPADIFHYTPIGFSLLVFFTYFLINIKHIHAFVLTISAQFIFYTVFFTLHSSELPVKIILSTVAQVNIIFFLLSYFNEKSNKKLFLYTRSLQSVYDKKNQINEEFENAKIKEIKQCKEKCRLLESQIKELKTRQVYNYHKSEYLYKITDVIFQIDNETDYKNFFHFINSYFSENKEETVSFKDVFEQLKTQFVNQKIKYAIEADLELKTQINAGNIKTLVRYLMISSIQLADNELEVGVSQIDETAVEVYSKFVCKNPGEVQTYINNVFNTNEIPERYLYLLLLKNALKLLGLDLQVELFDEQIELFFSIDGEVENKHIEEKNVDIESIAGKNILIVDDNIENLLYFETVSLQMRYNIYKAKNGADAIEIYKKNSKSIVAALLDYQLPDITGEELANELKKLNPELKILIISAFELKKIKNVDGVLRKPIGVEQLKDEITKLFTVKS